MKKILLFISLIGTILLTACTDYNDQFDGLDERVKLVVQQNYETEITAADISSIVAALNAKKTHADSAMAQSLNSNQAFSEEVPAAITIPYALNKRYLGMDINSAANVTYSYKLKSANHTDKILNAIRNPFKISPKEYEVARGDSTHFFTPDVTPNSKIPAILQDSLGNGAEGDLIIVEYVYGDREPTAAPVTLLAQDFENFGDVAGTAIKEGWDTLRISGTANPWGFQIHSGSGAKYVQARSYSGAGKVAYVSPAIILSSGKSNRLSLDLTVGRFDNPCLQIFISPQANSLSNAVDLTSLLSVPTTGPSGNNWATPVSLSCALNEFNGIYYLMFVYDGDAAGTPVRTSGYQIDNIKVVQSEKTASTPPTTYQCTDVYMYKNSQWVLCGNSTGLSDRDYKAMEITSPLSATTAPLYLPQYLALKYPYAQADKILVVAYKSGTSYAIDEYIFKDGTWIPNDLRQKRTEQFVFSGWDNIGWIFDPTIRYEMQKSDYQMILDFVQQYHNSYFGDGIPPATVHTNSEFYYGATTYRDAFSWGQGTWGKSPEWVKASDKEKFYGERTQAGVEKLLELKYPNATPTVSGIEQYAYITTRYYNEAGASPKFYYLTYEFKCIGNKQWEFVKREEKK